MLRIALAATLVLAPSLAVAQTGTPPKRIRSVEIMKGQKCPVAERDEVVVCRTIAEPYRIPAALRDEGAASAPQNQSWVNRAATVDQVGREAGGLPNTCSVVGTGGQTGCAQQAASQWAADRRARNAAARASTDTGSDSARGSASVSGSDAGGNTPQ